MNIFHPDNLIVNYTHNFIFESDADSSFKCACFKILVLHVVSFRKLQSSYLDIEIRICINLKCETRSTRCITHQCETKKIQMECKSFWFEILLMKFYSLYIVCGSIIPQPIGRSITWISLWLLIFLIFFSFRWFSYKFV